jgi:hypothetical protein
LLCVFIGTQAAYESYRDSLSRSDQPDVVSPDYKTQASALLNGTPYDYGSLNPDAAVTGILRTWY